MRLTCLKFKDSRRLKKPVSLKSVLIISFFGFIFLLAFSPLILAAFEVGNPDYLISKTYGSNFSITGWINMSFEYESSDSIFAASFDSEAETSMSLKEILELNPGYNYICTPIDCEKDYSKNNPQTTKNFNIGSGESKIIGLVFDGNFQFISDFSMDISSNAVESDSPQLLIDILDNNETEWGPYKGSGQFGAENYGCYQSPAEGAAIITQTEYCGRVTLSPAPNFKIGAKVTQRQTGNAEFSMIIKKNIGDWYDGICEATISKTGSISCIAKDWEGKDFSVKENGEFFVCISAKTDSENMYEIGYEKKDSCGYSGGVSGWDFEVFAKQGKYDSIGSFTLNNTATENYGVLTTNLENYIGNYISKRYKNDCQTGCIVPIRFFSQQENQQIQISNINVMYQSGIFANIKRAYDITESSARITSDNSQKIYLDLAEFNVPEETGNYTFTLNLNSEEIFSEEIEVKDVPIIQSIDPLLTTTGFPITFEVKVTLPNDVSVEDYEWEFFDTVGNVTRTETTTINKVIHIYSETGTYNLRVSATDFKGMSSSKTFEINVTSPKGLIRTNLDKIDKNIERINSFTSGLPLFQKSSINSVLEIENISSQLKRLEQEYNAAITPEENLAELNNIIEELVEIRLPNTIFKSVQADSSLFFPELGFMDVDVIQTVAGLEITGNYTGGNEENYKKAVSAWQQENLDVTFDFNKFSADYNAGTESLVSTFEFIIEEKSDVSYDYFVFVPVLEGIGFDKSMQQESGFYYTVLGDNSVSRISFYTTEDLDFIELPVFISPSVSRLSVAEPSITEKKPKMIIFILVLALLAILGIAAYILLFQWYKKKYEGYLFPNRNDLYNVVHYINRSKNKGLTNKQIIRNLKKANWNSEQIRYVMRRYEGKRTGMVEIPITKLIKKIEKEKMKEQKEQRQGGPQHSYGSHTGHRRPRHRRY